MTEQHILYLLGAYVETATDDDVFRSVEESDTVSLFYLEEITRIKVTIFIK